MMLLSVLAGLFAVIILSGCSSETSRFEKADQAAIPDSLRRKIPGSYPVTMEPAGTWFVRKTPENIVAYQAIEAEMAIALGKSQGLTGVFGKKNLQSLADRYYKQIPRLTLPLASMQDFPFSDQLDRELFLGIDADVFLIDPRLPVSGWGWTSEELAQVTNRVAPFFGNFIRYPRNDSYGPEYPAYTLEESLAIHARLFKAEKRKQYLLQFLDSLRFEIQSALPPKSARPTMILLAWGSDPAQGKFFLKNLERGGVETQHYQDLGISQAYDQKQFDLGKWGQTDYETLAKIDPDILIVNWGTILSENPEDFHKRFVKPMQEHPVGRRLKAIQNNRLLPGGSGEQGILTYFFQLEMAAKQLYPEIFGDWNWKAKPDSILWSREKLSRILAGEPL